MVVFLTATACDRNPSDRDLQAALIVRLAMDPAIMPYELTVSVTDRIVSLEGQTRSRDEQQHAIELARAVPGIADVRSNLRLLDSAIQSAVIASLRADPVVGSVPINVTVFRGGARLESGETDSGQRHRAVEIARSVDGVVRVEDFMR